MATDAAGAVLSLRQGAEAVGVRGLHEGRVVSGAVLHVGFSRVDAEARMVKHCPTCKRRRRMYGWFQQWYGWIVTCCHCGEKWCDGEMLPRPFERGWRRESALRARVRWVKATREPVRRQMRRLFDAMNGGHP